MTSDDLTLDELIAQNQKLTTVAGLVQNLLEIQAASLVEIFRGYQFPVGERQSVIDVSVIPVMPIISFSIVNDGPDYVYCWVNEVKNIKEQDVSNDSLHNIAPLKNAPILVGETMKFDIKFSGIKKIILQCNMGDSSTVRIFTEGKRPIQTQEVGN